MGIELYGFAFFIFCLACLALVIHSKLFADVTRQKKMLDEKETKLLRLYQSVEEALDDFQDSVSKGYDELDEKIKAFEQRMEAHEAAAILARKQADRADKPGAARRQAGGRAAKAETAAQALPEVAEPRADITQLVALETTAGEAVKPEFKSLLDSVRQVEVVLPQGSSNRNDSILLLSQSGKTRAQIAKELGITLSEVDLVLGMNRW